MTTVNVSSVMVERPLISAMNNLGYATYRIFMPNIVVPTLQTVDGVTITNEGSGYSTPPTVNFSGGGGTGAAGTAVLGFAISTVAVNTPGAYVSFPTIGATVGSLATFTCTLKATAVGIIGGGSGYTAGDTLTVVGGTGTAATLHVITVDGGGGITSLAVLTGGSYTVLPTIPVSVTGGTGVGGGFGLTFGLNTITVTAGGKDYDSTSVITITGGGGLGGGAATITLASTGGVKAVTMTANGNNYTSAPTVSFTGGGGTLAAGTAYLEGPNEPITIPLAFSIPLPSTNYTVTAIANQPVVANASSKTVDGFNVTLTPVNGASLIVGTMDVTVDFIL